MSGEGKRVAVHQTQGQQRLSTPVCDIVPGHRCKVRGCVTGLETLEQDTLQEWRDRALEGQLGRRTVIQEMVRSGFTCSLLIQKVTGAGHSCIVRTRRKMM